MPCHNQQLSSVSSGQEQPMKQVRFANSSSSSSSSVPAVLPAPDAGDGSIYAVNQDNIGPQLKLLPLNDQIRELQTIIRDK